ncbi:MAG: hypothetical protein GC165_18875 [Armatimonadetes bacterium]|nr:hypothetical protein [Armatimonadota bacterium]
MISALAFTTAFLATPLPQESSTSWKAELRKEIPLLGHRNWIVVADSAYPAQNSPGIRTIVTHASQIEVLKEVLSQLSKAKHVMPIVHLDKELSYVPEADARGVTAYRKELASLLKGKPTQSELHEDIIKNLDDAGKTFRVLLLKTDFTVPYTSVFLQLDCAYWGPEKEAKLRKIMNKG